MIHVPDAEELQVTPTKLLIAEAARRLTMGVFLEHEKELEELVYLIQLCGLKKRCPRNKIVECSL